MKRVALSLASLALALLILSGCRPVDMGVTVRGTITGDYQTGRYFALGVPSGSCTLVVTFVSDNFWDPISPATYSIAGGSQGIVADSDLHGDAGPTTYTIMFNNVPLNKDENIDIHLGDGG